MRWGKKFWRRTFIEWFNHSGSVFFWGSNFDGVFLREQFRESKFENASSEEATYIEKRKGRKMIRWPNNVDSDKE